MSSSLAALEDDKKQYQEQLDLVHASLQDDPDNAELLGLKSELDEMLAFIVESIADLQPKRPSAPTPASAATKYAAVQPPPPTPQAAQQQTFPRQPPSDSDGAPPPPPPEPEKWSRANHPALKAKAAAEEAARLAAEAAAAESSAPIVYQVNDIVLAKWVSGDKGFYPARITSVTGSSTQPIYTVRFKSYDTVETVRGRDVRPLGGTGKRKADDDSGQNTPGTAAASTTSSNGIVTTSAPSVYPQAAATPTGEEKPTKKFKKIKANKVLEEGKNKWQSFNAKGKGPGKKDSMFRVPDGVHGRVGFTGSGQAMRKDPTRSRHIYQSNEDND